MQSYENPVDALIGLSKDFLIAVYRLVVSLAISIIVLGKFVFDNLYQLVDNDKNK
jgi:hypothetical protein